MKKKLITVLICMCFFVPMIGIAYANAEIPDLDVSFGVEDIVDCGDGNHSIVIDKAVEATYDKTGLTEGKHCSWCEKVILEQKIVPVKKLATPVVKISNVTTGVKITWNKVSGAENYKVYRKTGSGSWVAIKSGVKGTSYTDTTAKSGTAYYYTVRAIKGTYQSSYKSSGVVKRTK